MAIVSLNEAPQYEPPESKPESEPLNKILEDMLSRAKKARQRFDQVWQANYEFVFGGKQWSIDRPAWRFSETVNLTWANIMTEVGIQTDARPRVEYHPVEASDFEFTKQLAKINELNWMKYPWLQKVSDNVLQSKWVHVSHAEICWNQDLEDGLGDIEYKILDPFYCYWDPTACDIEECRYFIYSAPVPTAKLKKEYPQFADQLKSDIETIGGRYSDVVSTASDRMRYGGNINARSIRQSDQFGGEPMTLLKRYWMKDDTIEEFEEENDGEKEYVQKLKYPKGRYIEKAGSLILSDGPNGVKIGEKIVPYEDGKFPIARLVNYSYPLEYAGECEVTHLRGPQKVYNYIWSHALDQMKMNANPKTIIGATSGVDPDNVSNEPGVKVLANDVNQIRFEPGVALAPGMDAIMQNAKNTHDMVSGLTDVMKGAVDPAVGSGVLFEGYAEAAQVRPRLKNRNLDQFLQRIGQLMLSRYLQFYTAPRVFRVTNEQGWPEFVEFYISTDKKGKKFANVTKTASVEGPQGREYVPQPQQQMEIKGTPDVEVVSGSSLPFSKALKSKTALEYFNAGIIDQEEVLKAIDWPNASQLLERMKKIAMEQAQMQVPK